ncbi:MAG: flavodoxin family protein [Bacteroidetes bacterium]|nr:flavodoxin family protein [Bacteroidota bacterium]
MKFVAINGSPKGRASNTQIMVNAFLTGASEAGADISTVFLSEKEINSCKGCFSCWYKSPGKCVIRDDMTGVLSLLAGANLIILASPLYFNNISGTLKVFIDRLFVTGSPPPPGDAKAEYGQKAAAEPVVPKIMMISNCGFPDRSQFQVVSLWMEKVAALLKTSLAAEIYAVRGKLLSDPTDEVRPAVVNYLKLLGNSGKEMAMNMKLSETTEELLQRDYV